MAAKGAITVKSFVLKGHQKPITKIKTTREGDCFVSCSADKSAMLWRLDPLMNLGTFPVSGAVSDCAISDNGEFVYIGERNGEFQCNKLETGERVFATTIEQDYNPILGVELMPGDTQLLLLRGTFGTKKPSCLSVYDIAAQREAQRLIERPGTRLAKGTLALPTLYVAGDYEGNLILKDTRSREDDAVVVTSHLQEITDVECDPNHLLLATTSKDGKCFVHDIRMVDTVVSTFEAGYPLQCVGFSPYQDYYAVGGGQEKSLMTQTQRDMTMLMTTFVSAVDGKEFVRIPGHFGTVNTIVFSADGNKVITGSDDGCIRINPLEGKTFHPVD